MCNLLTIPTLTLCLGILLAAAPDAGVLKTITNPSGGSIIYGPLGPQSSPQTAMGEMLRHIHSHYGDRPQLGRLFNDRAGQSIAAFFNLTDKTQGNRPITGLLIVSVPPNGTAQAAVLTDDAKRFPATLNSMLRQLQAATAPSTSPPAPGPTGHDAINRAPAMRLNQTSFPDGSGSVGLPPGWQISEARGGDVLAKGPNGEWLRLGLSIPVIDPTNPQERAQFANAARYGRPAQLPGAYVAIPYGTDPASAYKSALAQRNQKMHVQPYTINITSVKEITAGGNGARTFVLQGDTDTHDGDGPKEMLVQFVMSRPFGPRGSWQIIIYQVVIPKPVMAQESSLVAAIMSSYQVNGQVINGELAAQMKASQAYTDAVLARGRQSEANTESILAQGRAHWDDEDRRSKAFQNYQLDQSVVRDTQEHAHGTFSNDFSDYLVKSNPDRFEYVPTKDFLKGIDY